MLLHEWVTSCCMPDYILGRLVPTFDMTVLFICYLTILFLFPTSALTLWAHVV